MSGRNPDVTRKIMSAIKQKDTEPEMLLRKALWKRGYRYRKHLKSLPGRPDIAFPGKKIAVFCDGDYWHGHNWAIRGLSSFEEELSRYSEFWRKKLRANVERDKRVNARLSEMGWRVIRLWESDIRKDVNACVEKIARAYHADAAAERETAPDIACTQK